MSEAAPPSSRVSRLIAVLGAVLLAALAWKAYSPHFGARPTERATAAKPVNLNAADRAELLQIPGVGPAMVDTILAHRQKHGRFESLDELDTLPGIGPKTVEKLRPWLAIGPGSPRTLVSEPVEKLERKQPPKSTSTLINVNTASAEELQTLPGIGPKLAERIIAERTKMRFVSADDLDRVPGIGLKTVEKLRPLVRFTE